MRFNKILKELRLEQGLTQTQLAKKSNLAPSCIAMFETEKREPNANSLIALSSALNVSTDYLLGLEDDFGAKTATAPAVMGENYSSEERQLIEDYQKLNSHSKKYLQDTIKMLLESVSGSEQKKKDN